MIHLLLAVSLNTSNVNVQPSTPEPISRGVGRRDQKAEKYVPPNNGAPIDEGDVPHGSGTRINKKQSLK